MSTIRSIFHREIQRLPEMALRTLLERKLQASDSKLPEQAFNALVHHIMSGGNDTFTWDGNEASENPEANKDIQLALTDQDLTQFNEALYKLLDIVPDLIHTTVEQVSIGAFHDLNERWILEGTIQRAETDGFCERLEERWGTGLDLLRMLLTCCREMGQEVHKRHRRSKSKRHANRRFVLTRLHVRACQVADEIIALMANGFADGAFARWRTLHELAVVATLIGQGDEALAERFIDHDAVDVKRQADDYQTTLVPLGYSPLSTRERRKIDASFDAVIAKHGQSFGSQYGWAADTKTKKPTFRDLQKAADRAGLNSHYKMASANVHATSRSMFFCLAAMNNPGMLVAGRSNAGLIEPGQNTAFALVTITGMLFGNLTNLDRVFEVKALTLIRDAATKALASADRKLRRDDKIFKTTKSKRPNNHRIRRNE